MTTFLLATRSDHKVREIRSILAAPRVEIRTLAEHGVPVAREEDDLERFDTFAANAAAKARYFARRLGVPVLADDSGLRVDALQGEPGVWTRRFSGRDDLDGQDLDDANNTLLLERLRDVPDADRGARYVCCAVLAWPDGPTLAATGTVGGRIAREPRGSGGFGYDPLFHVPELDARFAEVAPDVKNAISHRARAFRAMASLLTTSAWAPGGSR